MLSDFQNFLVNDITNRVNREGKAIGCIATLSYIIIMMIIRTTMMMISIFGPG